ncbi:transcriptional regulator [Bifidobacterium hapali]|uniref:Transcriptional regulator n=1 Tax=Bifidobacterium hapali TaxID=1630172 RepID=A0A261FU30_9BIFI|nr:winged helix-turn-helix domain-containing protein [Bifidobacterium hapali]OZG62618.1 transcriptional regulator [Bifidobacterium hapali]
MNLLFVTGSAALAAAVSHTLESAGNHVDIAMNIDELTRFISGNGDNGSTDINADTNTDTADSGHADSDHTDSHNSEYDAVLIDDLTAQPMMDMLAQYLSASQSSPQSSSQTASSVSSTSSSSSEAAANHVRPRVALLTTPSLSATTNNPTSDIVPDVTIVKPFGDAELLSYVALLRCDEQHGRAAQSVNPDLLIHGDLTLDTRTQRAYYRGANRPVALSPREYSALEALIRADGEFLSFDDLSRLVFGEGAGFADRHSVMDTTMYSLTRKLRRLGFFITQHGHQYRIR